MSETLSKHPLFKAIGNRVYDIEIHALMLDLRIMLGRLEHNRDTWRRRAIRQARLRIRIAGEKAELLAAIQRLPEPPSAFGDGPDERVGWILREYKAWKAAAERNLRATQYLKDEIWCLQGEKGKVHFLDASFDVKQRLVVAEAALAAIRERAERIQEGESLNKYVFLDFILKKIPVKHSPECLKRTAFEDCVCTCGAEEKT